MSGCPVFGGLATLSQKSTSLQASGILTLGMQTSHPPRVLLLLVVVVVVHPSDAAAAVAMVAQIGEIPVLLLHVRRSDAAAAVAIAHAV